VKIIRIAWVALITGALAALAVSQMGIETMPLLTWQWWEIVILINIITCIINNDRHASP
jgi:hypothetical protein